MLTFEMPTIEPPKRSLFTARDAVLCGCDAVAVVQWRQQFGAPILDSLIADALTTNTDFATAKAKRNSRAANP